MHKSASEKYNAVVFDLNRLRKVYKDTNGIVSNIDGQQAFLSFAAGLNSLRDWLMHEKLLLREEWESFLVSTKYLFLVAKIATQDKHAATDAPVWQNQHVGLAFNRHVVLIPPQGAQRSWITQGRYLIKSDDVGYDALDLAEAALEELRDFLKAKGVQLV